MQVTLVFILKTNIKCYFKNFIAALYSYDDTQEPPLANPTKKSVPMQVKPATEAVEGKSKAAVVRSALSHHSSISRSRMAHDVREL